MLSFKQTWRSAMLVALFGAVLSGCAVGPDYVRPEVEVPAAFKEQWKTAEPRAELPRGPWWQLFGDPELDRLIAQVEVSNQNIRAVEAQYRQARALAQQARSEYFPLLTGDAGVTRNRSSGSAGNAINVSPRYNTTYRAGLDASWEPDLWGRIQRSVESEVASMQARR